MSEFIPRITGRYSAISCGIRSLVGTSAFTEGAGVLMMELPIPIEDGDEDFDSMSISKGFTYIFSDNIHGNTKELVKFIRKYDLGEVIRMWPGIRRNPNSGNLIEAWSWHYNGNKLPKSLVDEYMTEDRHGILEDKWRTYDYDQF